MVGIPTYGRAFRVVKKPDETASNDTSSSMVYYVGTESEPITSPSVYTSEEGVLSYYEICELIFSNKDTRIYWDDMIQVPFAIVTESNNEDYNNQEKRNQNDDEYENEDEDRSNIADTSLWISYEDQRSASKKVEYVKQLSLGGVGLWSLDMDDFRGEFCIFFR